MSLVDYQVIDADAHTVESSAPFERFLDKEYRHLMPQMVRDEGGAARIVFEGRLWPPFPVGEHSSNLVDRKDSPEQRLTVMDGQGIDIQFLFPSFGLMVNFTNDAGYAAALCRAYNEWLADYCSHSPDRLKGIGVIALHDIGEAVREAERCVKRFNMKGILVRPNPICGRTLDNPYYDDLYASLSELDAPLCVHEGTGADETAGGNRYDIRRTDHYVFSHIISHPFEQMFAAMSIIVGGVLARFPKLRVGFFEAGSGWMPYWLWRLDEHYEHPVLRRQMPLLTMPPSEYFARQCWITFDCDEATAPFAVQSLGAGRVMFASDYPHFDTKAQPVLEVVETSAFSDEAKRQILSDTARVFYNMD